MTPTEHLILLDAEMPGVSGPDLCARLKADPELADIQVVFASAHVEPGAIRALRQSLGPLGELHVIPAQGRH